MFWVYVVHNNLADKFYIGQTDNVEKRIHEHNTPYPGKYTSRFKGEWQLIHKEEFATRSEAKTREKQLKSAKGREFVKNLIYSGVAQR